MKREASPAAKAAALAVAEYALGNLDIEVVPWYAAHWLAEGYEGSSLRELAGLDDSEPRQIRDLLPAVFGEMKVPIPAPGEAADTWFESLVMQLLAGDLGERDVSKSCVQQSGVRQARS
jgi:hypothetical protein